MATTPNFGWVTPAPTDFVTDLPADFETFADAVDADVQLIKNTADAAIPETLIDAAGDLIYGSAADTAARLAIGTAGQVLAVNSGATAPEWITSSSGGMTLLSTTSLSTTTTTITGISGLYNDLIVYGYDLSMNANDRINMSLRNNVTNLALRFNGVINVGASSLSDTQIPTNGVGADILAGQENRTGFIMYVTNYASTDFKPIDFYGNSVNKDTSVDRPFNFSGGCIAASAIDAINFFSQNGVATMSGTIKIYGVK